MRHKVAENDKLLFIERHPVEKYMAHDYDYVPLIPILSELYFLLIPEHYFHAAVVGSIDYYFLMPILLKKHVTSRTFSIVIFYHLSM